MLMKAGKKTPILEYARPSFGVGIGIFGSLVLFTLLAVLLFIPGFVLLKKEQAKEKDKQNIYIKAIAYVLMMLGTAIGMGFGAGTLLSELSGEF